MTFGNNDANKDNTNFCFREISYSPVYPALEQVHLRQYQLVVQTFQLGKKSVNQSECLRILLSFQLPVVRQMDRNIEEYTNNAASRVSKLCFKKIRFSAFAQATLSCSVRV